MGSTILGITIWILIFIALIIIPRIILRKLEKWEFLLNTRPTARYFKLTEERDYLINEYLKDPSGQIERRKLTKQFLRENDFKIKEMKKRIKEEK